MCGRFKLTAPTGRVFDEFSLTGRRLNLQPRYNLAPTQEAAVVRRMPTGRQISMIRWGLIPAWSPAPKPGESIGSGQINARAESVHEKPTFREAFRSRRCLVPADGFYEWTPEGGMKRPMLFERADGGVMAFAGLWETWDKGGDKGGAPLETFTIICTAANTLVGRIHDRMPVILTPDQYDLWLDPAVTDTGALLPLLTPYPADEMTVRPVSTRLNKVSAEDDASLLTPEPPVQGSLF